MVKLEITATSLVIHITGLDKLWTFKSQLEIPLAHVVGIESDEAEARTWHHGLKSPGINMKNHVTAGTFYEHGERVFWDVHKPELAVAIKLKDDRFQRLVIEVEDVAATIAAVRAAIPKA